MSMSISRRLPDITILHPTKWMQCDELSGKKCEEMSQLWETAVKEDGSVIDCSSPAEALSLLRNDKNAFDLVITDAHFSAIDGIEVLELVKRETDLPVVMISGDIRTGMAFDVIKKGVCDFLIKPLKISDVQNIWVHVLVRKCSNFITIGHSGRNKQSDHNIQVTNVSKVDLKRSNENDSSSQCKHKQRYKRAHDEDNINTFSSRKPRFVWPEDLHRKFVDAVNQLGIDRAVPRRIVEVMNVPGITREIIGSHLQKYRLHLKQIEGTMEQQDGSRNFSYRPLTTDTSQLPQQNLHGLTASSQVCPQIPVFPNNENLFCQPYSFPISAMNQQTLLQDSSQGMEHAGADKFQFYSPLQTDDGVTPFEVYPPYDLSSMAPTTNMWGSSTCQNGNMLDLIPQQQPPKDFDVLGGPLLLSQNFANDSLYSSSDAKVTPSSILLGNYPAPQIEGSEVFPSQPFIGLPEMTPHFVNQASVTAPSQLSDTFMENFNVQGGSLPLSRNSANNSSSNDVVAPSSISLGNYPALQTLDSEVFTSQPFTNLLDVTPYIVNHGSVTVPSSLPGTFMEENYLASLMQNESFKNSEGIVDCSGFPSPLSMGSNSNEGGFNGNFDSVANINTFSASDMVPSPVLPNFDVNSSWQMQCNYNNFGYDDLHSSIIPGSLNIHDTNGFSEQLPDLGQGSGTGSVNRHTFPSQFGAEDIVSLADYSTACISDENYMMKQYLPFE